MLHEKSTGDTTPVHGIPVDRWVCTLPDRAARGSRPKNNEAPRVGGRPRIGVWHARFPCDVFCSTVDEEFNISLIV